MYSIQVYLPNIIKKNDRFEINFVSILVIVYFIT